MTFDLMPVVAFNETQSVYLIATNDASANAVYLHVLINHRMFNQSRAIILVAFFAMVTMITIIMILVERNCSNSKKKDSKFEETREAIGTESTVKRNSEFIIPYFPYDKLNKKKNM